MSTTGIALSAVEFEVAWQELGLGRMPYPLVLPTADRPVRERAREALWRRGLWYEGPIAALAEPLGVLASGRTTVDAVGFLGGPVRALSAEDGWYGAVAVAHRAGVWVAAIPPEALVHEIVRVTGDAPAGRGPSLTVPVEELRSGGEHAAELAALLAERRAGGQFGCTATTGSGRRSRARTLVSWFDTPGGRYLLVREDGWVSLAPADRPRMAHRLGEVVTAPELAR
ncbi:ESX secretion-associated protein EspG [Actinophytocola xanthii]|nr:ESX secretion-associated protein EspG [Actinophytocola xanthii]